MWGWPPSRPMRLVPWPLLRGLHATCRYKARPCNGASRSNRRRSTRACKKRCGSSTAARTTRRNARSMRSMRAPPTRPNAWPCWNCVRSAPKPATTCPARAATTTTCCGWTPATGRPSAAASSWRRAWARQTPRWPRRAPCPACCPRLRWRRSNRRRWANACAGPSPSVTAAATTCSASARWTPCCATVTRWHAGSRPPTRRWTSPNGVPCSVAWTRTGWSRCSSAEDATPMWWRCTTRCGPAGPRPGTPRHRPRAHRRACAAPTWPCRCTRPRCVTAAMPCACPATCTWGWSMRTWTPRSSRRPTSCWPT